MHTISRRKLREFWERKENAGSMAVLDVWYKTMDRSVWRNISDLRETFPHADLVGSCTVFNVGGNKFRVIAYISFRTQRCYVLHVLTHKEYDREAWKKDCEC